MQVIDDLRFSLRMLRRNRSLTTIAVLTLALGIGVNTAIYSTVATYFWTPLPYPDVDRVVMITGSNPKMGWSGTSISYLDAADWRAASSVESLSIYRSTSLALSGAGEPQNIFGISATPELFDVLQVRAALGRTFDEAEKTPGEHRVAVITDSLWRRQLGADPSAVGRDMKLDGKTYMLIGVMPASFHFFYNKAEVFTPLDLPPDRIGLRAARWLRCIARLKPGATVDQAAAEVSTISRNLEASYPDSNRDWSGRVIAAADAVIDKGARMSISTMYYAVTVVLLIACVNVAALLLSRGTLRRKEFAIRASLGAGRAAIMRLVLTESAVLGILGGILGVAFAYASMPLLRTIAPPDMPQSQLIALDERGLLYGVAVALISGLIAGVAPAIAMTRGQLATAMHSAGRGNTGSRQRTLRSLVVTEVALSVVLLTAGGLMIRSMIITLTAGVGFDKSQLITGTVALPKALYPEKRQAIDFMRAALERVQSSPQVVAAAATETLPLGGSNAWAPIFAEGADPNVSKEERMTGQMIVTPDYFATMRIPILAGRSFTNGDGPDAPKVVIVNETLAKRYWPSDPRPIGRRIRQGNEKSEWLTVVGLARDVRHQHATVPPRPEVYVPHAQGGTSAMILVARTRSDPHQGAQILRSAVWSVDPNQPVYNVETMDEVIDRRMAGPRATTEVMGFLAFLALALAAVGIYGVIGYMTSQRAREIGIRLALGAGRGSVFGMVLRGGVVLAGIGLAFGVAAAAGLAPLLHAIIAVKPHDATTYAATASILMAVALAATLAPAVRAMRLDPIQVLRDE